MEQASKRDAAAASMRQINRAWLNGQIENLTPMLHPEIIMVFPGFAGNIQGRENFVDGFRDFCRNARVHEFRETDHQVNIIADVAVITYRYEMVYERLGRRFQATGRDLWIFQNQGEEWLAVWRTMLDVDENAL
jgi:Domain of unknown function (DUF4440)